MIRPRWSSRAGQGVMNHEVVTRSAEDAIRELLAGPSLPGAACTNTDPEVWFPEKGGSTKLARTLCRGGEYHGKYIPPCPVRAACLAGALDLPSTVTHYGTWAGYTAPRLRRMRELRAALRKIVCPSAESEPESEAA